MPKIRFWPGGAPDFAGELMTLPQAPTSAIPHPLDSYGHGVSISAPLAPRAEFHFLYPEISFPYTVPNHLLRAVVHDE